MIKEITSKENPNIKYALKLKDSSFRKKEQKFIADTQKTLFEALKHHLVQCVFTVEKLDIDESIPQYIVPIELLKKISSNNSPKVTFIGKIKTYNYQECYHKILYLDHVNDPGNLGTLIRTALAFSFDCVVVSNGCCDIYNEKVINSSKGAIFSIPIFEQELSYFKGKLPILVSSLSFESVDIKTFDKPDKFVLVVGNESSGVSEESISLSDSKIIIPISNIDSLNVSLAGAIMMYELTKK